jgi:signal transduction histidine kinase
MNVNDTVAEMMKMLRRMVSENIEIVTSTRPNLGQVRADPGQIEQILLNLVVNASDAMPGGGRLTVETSNVKLDETYARTHAEVTPGDYVMLAVSDTGVGIDSHILPRIFEPFFTTKEHGKGTGLGLSTVYGIVKQNDGHVWVYSEPGQGTSFKVYLPRVDEQSETDVEEVHAPETLKGSETVLLVEDDQLVRRLAQAALEINGYRVLVAGGGAEALELCGQHGSAIQLVVTDGAS